MEQFDLAFKRFVINAKIPFPVMAKYANADSTIGYYSNCYCPFHENTDTPAAKCYQDEDGDTLFCFAEHRRYKPYDFIRRGLMKDMTEKLFTGIWNQLTEEQRRDLIQRHGTQKSFLSEKDEKILKEMELFKEGKLTYQEVKKLIARLGT